MIEGVVVKEIIYGLSFDAVVGLYLFHSVSKLPDCNIKETAMGS